MEQSLVISLLSRYELPAIFLGAFFFGESVILAATFLAAEGVWPLYGVFWLSLTGTLVADCMWFLLSKPLFAYLNRWGGIEAKYGHYLQKLENKDPRKQFYYLIFFKFLYGTRIITIMYTSIQKMPFWKFIVIDTISTILWLTTMMGVGWLIWKGIVHALPTLHIIQYTLTATIVLVILVRLFTKWTSNKIIKE